jgi:hypothetical protein
MLDAQENPKPEKSLLTQSQSEQYLIRRGRGRPQFISREELTRLTTTSRIRRIRGNPNNVTAKQVNNVTTQTDNQHNTTQIRLKPNTSKNEHIREQTYHQQSSGEDTLRVVCGKGTMVSGCMVKWLSTVYHSIVACVRGHAYSLYTFTTTTSGYVVKCCALLYSCVSHILTVCTSSVAHRSHLIAQFCSTHRAHSQVVSPLPYSLTSHPKSTHRKGGRGVVVRVLCWGGLGEH